MAFAEKLLLWFVLALSAIEVGWAQQEQAVWLDRPISYMRMAEELRLLAEEGRPDAQTQLGEMYEHGLGAPQNFYKAIDLYRKAALNGYKPALIKLRSLGVNVFAEPPTEVSDTDEAVENEAKSSTKVTIRVGSVTSSGSTFDLWSNNTIIVTRPMKPELTARRRPFMNGQRRSSRGLLFPTQGSRSGVITGPFR